ncbi:hypothetical protein IQ251_18730 [Saccharopolyspora sp. HNM0983]|uniref:Mut7-C ubiquitin/RNAse domain-containing protein n=2 Tax=Saccharopolyspora montiporae TaxID=2781240 RepID=A0A929G1B4_9PSEU|nr:hypothetical protein [Saccharopolyspora sp. HNM0983]
MDTPVQVHLDPALQFFLDRRHRPGPVRVAHDGTATAGHIVQSLGVPLTEVGSLRTGGGPVAPAHRPAPGTVLQVDAVPRPQPGTRFLLDVHLGKLARRMRLLGLDTAYRNDADDRQLVHRSRIEDRVLLSRDRGLLQRAALPAGAHVRGTAPDDQLADVLDRFRPELAPWTRCTACNGLLRPADKDEVRAELEAGTLRTHDEYARCPECGKVYWRGAHSRRIEAIIRAARE